MAAGEFLEYLGKGISNAGRTYFEMKRQAEMDKRAKEIEEIQKKREQQLIDLALRDQALQEGTAAVEAAGPSGEISGDVLAQILKGPLAPRMDRSVVPTEMTPTGSNFVPFAPTKTRDRYTVRPTLEQQAAKSSLEETTSHRAARKALIDRMRASNDPIVQNFVTALEAGMSEPVPLTQEQQLNFLKRQEQVKAPFDIARIRESVSRYGIANQMRQHPASMEFFNQLEKLRANPMNANVSEDELMKQADLSVSYIYGPSWKQLVTSQAATPGAGGAETIDSYIQDIDTQISNPQTPGKTPSEKAQSLLTVVQSKGFKPEELARYKAILTMKVANAATARSR